MQGDRSAAQLPLQRLQAVRRAVRSPLPLDQFVHRDQESRLFPRLCHSPVPLRDLDSLTDPFVFLELWVGEPCNLRP